VALQLLENGYKNVHPLYGGFDAWQQAGLPVDPK
jgi:rhodanese-related sulfurtransferase